jgi:hypothetical protein
MSSEDSLFASWFCGGLANAITSAILNPLDVAKTRMQLDLQNKSTLRSTLYEMYSRNGIINGCYRPGLNASCMREMLSSGPRAGLYIPARNWAITNVPQFGAENSQTHEVVCKIVASMCTATVGSLVANPMDVVKIRMMLPPVTLDIHLYFLH